MKKPTNKQITQVLNGLIMELESIKIRLSIVEEDVIKRKGKDNEGSPLQSDS